MPASSSLFLIGGSVVFSLSLRAARKRTSNSRDTFSPSGLFFFGKMWVKTYGVSAPALIAVPKPEILDMGPLMLELEKKKDGWILQEIGIGMLSVLSLFANTKPAVIFRSLSSPNLAFLFPFRCPHRLSTRREERRQAVKGQGIKGKKRTGNSAVRRSHLWILS